MHILLYYCRYKAGFADSHPSHLPTSSLWHREEKSCAIPQGWNKWRHQRCLSCRRSRQGNLWHIHYCQKGKSNHSSCNDSYRNCRNTAISIPDGAFCLCRGGCKLWTSGVYGCHIMKMYILKKWCLWLSYNENVQFVFEFDDVTIPAASGFISYWLCLKISSMAGFFLLLKIDLFFYCKISSLKKK